MSVEVDRYTVVIEPQGWHFEAVSGVSLVESARNAGLVLPTSCRNGTCRACLCRVLSGRVRHLIDWPGLSSEEKHAGCILPCVATPETALRIEAPRAVESPVAPPGAAAATD
ncbi:MAG: 2Fe-2S iron-sulfur cluster-binding protein [Pseudomonadota bacterium]|nr:2Fe-2S iron-sulfur cluster-binding protein [Pseudomonadota bacterium]